MVFYSMRSNQNLVNATKEVPTSGNSANVASAESTRATASAESTVSVNNSIETCSITIGSLGYSDMMWGRRLTSCTNGLFSQVATLTNRSRELVSCASSLGKISIGSVSVQNAFKIRMYRSRHGNSICQNPRMHSRVSQALAKRVALIRGGSAGARTAGLVKAMTRKRVSPSPYFFPGYILSKKSCFVSRSVSTSWRSPFLKCNGQSIL